VQSSSSIQLPTSSPTTQSSSSAQPSIPSSSSLEEISNEPRLVGTCRWDIKVSETTTARGAVPSGVTLSDPNNVCRGAKVVYKYDDGEKTWSSTGILSEWKNWDKKHIETYSDVQATIDCPDYEDDIEPKDCPTLIVNAGADHIIELNCDGVRPGYPVQECKGKNEVILQLDECVDMIVLNYSGIYDGTNELMRPAIATCQVGQGGNGNAELYFNGKSIKINNYYVEVDLGKFKSGEYDFGTLCLINGGPTVKCKLESR